MQKKTTMQKKNYNAKKKTTMQKKTTMLVNSEKSDQGPNHRHSSNTN
jgi:hypothetical protein